MCFRILLRCQFISGYWCLFSYLILTNKQPQNVVVLNNTIIIYYFLEIFELGTQVGLIWWFFSSTQHWLGALIHLNLNGGCLTAWDWMTQEGFIHIWALSPPPVSSFNNLAQLLYIMTFYFVVQWKNRRCQALKSWVRYKSRSNFQAMFKGQETRLHSLMRDRHVHTGKGETVKSHNQNMSIT